MQATTKKYWPLFWEQVDIAAPIINPAQRELVPMFRNMAETTKEQRRDSQWVFGYPVPLRHNRPRVGGQPGSSNVSVTRGG